MSFVVQGSVPIQPTNFQPTKANTSAPSGVQVNAINISQQVSVTTLHGAWLVSVLQNDKLRRNLSRLKGLLTSHQSIEDDSELLSEIASILDDSHEIQEMPFSKGSGGVHISLMSHLKAGDCTSAIKMIEHIQYDLDEQLKELMQEHRERLNIDNIKCLNRDAILSSKKLEQLIKNRPDIAMLIQKLNRNDILAILSN